MILQYTAFQIFVVISEQVADFRNSIVTEDRAPIYFVLYGKAEFQNGIPLPKAISSLAAKIISTLLVLLWERNVAMCRRV